MNSCPFCSRLDSRSEFVAENASAAAFLDGFPVSEGHTLVVPKAHVERPEEIGSQRWNELFELVREVAASTSSQPGVDGLNIGINCGEAAGQTIGHAHVHVIPRREGDVPDPRGGVRWVLPEKADYWTGG